MSNITEPKNLVVKLLPRIKATDSPYYVNARYQADTAERDEGLIVANMPALINLLKFSNARSEIRRVLRAASISGEYHLPSENGMIYVIAHDKHPFRRPKRLESGSFDALEYEPEMRKRYVMPISHHEVRTLLHDSVHINDLKKGFVANNNNIMLNISEDNNITKSGPINYEQWMCDNRILAICGSEDARDYLGNFFFKKKRTQYANNYYDIHDFECNKAFGYLLALCIDGIGIVDESSSYIGASKCDSLEVNVLDALKAKVPFEYQGSIYVQKQLYLDN